MLLTERRGRPDPADGALVPLDEQDRSLWRRDLIEEGVDLTRTLPVGPVGPYQVQAAIAAVHDEAARAEDTDWPQVLALYGVLERIAPNPIVTLNRAVALAMVRGRRRVSSCWPRSTPTAGPPAATASSPSAPPARTGRRHRGRPGRLPDQRPGSPPAGPNGGTWRPAPPVWRQAAPLRHRLN